jgi:hypothetical protein
MATCSGVLVREAHDPVIQSASFWIRRFAGYDGGG